MGFLLNSVQINVNRSVPIQTICGGFLCDKQRVQDWNEQRGCGCYNMTQYRSNLVIKYSVNFKKKKSRVVECHMGTSYHIVSHNFI